MLGLKQTGGALLPQFHQCTHLPVQAPACLLAQVYKGLYHGLQPVAVKVLHADTDPRVLQEFVKEVSESKDGWMEVMYSSAVCQSVSHASKEGP